MPSRVNARPPGAVTPPELDRGAVPSILEDAAHYPGGYATGVLRPRSIDEVSASLAGMGRVLAVGAQSSLTGGATPFGDVVLSTDRLTSITVSSDRARVGAGVPLQLLQERLAETGRWFPPVPTYLGAFAGGAVATCAAGAATFKYGSVRKWVEGLTVVLAGGDVLTLARGKCVAGADGVFEIGTATGVRRIHVPSYHMPNVPKVSAGYYAAPNMDLIDLFIGSEGTLGVIVEATLRTMPKPPAICRALVPMPSEEAAITLVGILREAAIHAWRSKDPNGVDIAAIEHIDERSIAVIREDGIDRKLALDLSGCSVALLIDLELPRQQSRDTLWRLLEDALGPDAPDEPLVRFCRLLGSNLLDTQIALPDDRGRIAALTELREAVPAGVNRRVAIARRQDPSISKTAADMIVPFDRFADMMSECRRVFAERDLDLAVWGHISDGNVHPNLIPRSAADVEKGREAILELGTLVIDMDGCPLAEHGVGRNPIKQQLLRQLYGDAGIDAMRAVKLSLDPQGSLASGVIFPSK